MTLTLESEGQALCESHHLGNETRATPDFVLVLRSGAHQLVNRLSMTMDKLTDDVTGDAVLEGTGSI